jgi:hypothetical protein
MLLKIISDGTPRGTRVIDADTGELVEKVTHVDVHIDVDNIRAWIQVVQPELDIIAELTKNENT